MEKLSRTEKYKTYRDGINSDSEREIVTKELRNLQNKIIFNEKRFGNSSRTESDLNRGRKNTSYDDFYDNYYGSRNDELNTSEKEEFNNIEDIFGEINRYRDRSNKSREYESDYHQSDDDSEDKDEYIKKISEIVNNAGVHSREPIQHKTYSREDRYNVERSFEREKYANQHIIEKEDLYNRNIQRQAQQKQDVESLRLNDKLYANSETSFANQPEITKDIVKPEIQQITPTNDNFELENNNLPPLMTGEKSDSSSNNLDEELSFGKPKEQSEDENLGFGKPVETIKTNVESNDTVNIEVAETDAPNEKAEEKVAFDEPAEEVKEEQLDFDSTVADVNNNSFDAIESLNNDVSDQGIDFVDQSLKDINDIVENIQKGDYKETINLDAVDDVEDKNIIDTSSFNEEVENPIDLIEEYVSPMDDIVLDKPEIKHILPQIDESFEFKEICDNANSLADEIELTNSFGENTYSPQSTVLTKNNSLEGLQNDINKDLINFKNSNDFMDSIVEEVDHYNKEDGAEEIEEIVEEENEDQKRTIRKSEISEELMAEYNNTVSFEVDKLMDEIKSSKEDDISADDIIRNNDIVANEYSDDQIGKTIAFTVDEGLSIPDNTIVLSKPIISEDTSIHTMSFKTEELDEKNDKNNTLLNIILTILVIIAIAALGVMAYFFLITRGII